LFVAEISSASVCEKIVACPVLVIYFDCALTFKTAIAAMAIERMTFFIIVVFLLLRQV